MTEQNSSDRFALWRKWFWIGVIIAIINILTGFVYGIALTLEKGKRREGVIIIIVAIAWYIFASYFLGPWLMKMGVIPHYQLLRTS